VVVHAERGIAVFERQAGRLAWMYGGTPPFEPYVTEDAVVVVRPDPAGGREVLVHDLPSGQLRVGLHAAAGTDVRVTEAGVYTVDCQPGRRPACRLRATNLRTGAVEWERLFRHRIWLPVLAKPSPTPVQRGLDVDPVTGLAAPADSVVVAAPGPEPAIYDLTLGVGLHQPAGTAHTTGGLDDQFLAAGPVVLRWPVDPASCIVELRADDPMTGRRQWSALVGRWRERQCAAPWQPTVADGALYGIGPDRFPFVVDLANGYRWISGRRATYPVGYTDGVAVTGGGTDASLAGYGRAGARLWRVGEANGFDQQGQFAVTGGWLLRMSRSWFHGQARDLLAVRRADTGRLVALTAADTHLFGVGADAIVGGIGLRDRPGTPVEVRLFPLRRR